MENFKDSIKDFFHNIKLFIFGNSTDFYPKDSKAEEEYIENKFKKKR